MSWPADLCRCARFSVYIKLYVGLGQVAGSRRVTSACLRYALEVHCCHTGAVALGKKVDERHCVYLLRSSQPLIVRGNM